MFGLQAATEIPISMAESDANPNQRPKEEPSVEKAEPQVVQNERTADVLEEDDDFEEFQYEGKVSVICL